MKDLLERIREELRLNGLSATKEQEQWILKLLTMYGFSFEDINLSQYKTQEEFEIFLS